MADFFPNGWAPYLLGGLLVGVATGGIFLSTGLRPGASSVFTTSWSWLSRLDYFQRPAFRASRAWRLVFTLGLIAGAAAFAAGHGGDWVTSVPAWRLGLGGILVGYGTRLSNGCTSGHGICGISAGSGGSLLAVMVFMSVAIVVAFAAHAAGVTP